MQIDLSRYRVKLAETEAEREGAQRLRYRVFVEEMGARATPEERAARREWDAFDPFFDHLILESLDPAIADPLDRVVGVYRLMRDDVARGRAGLLRRRRVRPDADRASRAGRASSSAAPASRRSTAAGRRCTCSGTGWPSYVLERGIELLFGVASFHGTDPAPLAEALVLSCTTSTWRRPDLRVRAQPAHYLDMNLMPREAIDAARALQAIPPLIKAYLRLGGFVGDGAFIDRDFNTIDVCVVMDTGADDRALPALLPARRGGAGGEGRLERGRAAGAAAADRLASGCGWCCGPPGRCWRWPCFSRSSCRSAASTSGRRGSPAGR